MNLFIILSILSLICFVVCFIIKVKTEVGSTVNFIAEVFCIITIIWAFIFVVFYVADDSDKTRLENKKAELEEAGYNIIDEISPSNNTIVVEDKNGNLIEIDY